VPNILVVDDTPANLVVLCEMLQSKGYKPRPVPSGELALRTAASLPPDLVLLDISMPGMDGYQTCASLKRNPALAEVPVIFVTARHEADSKVRGFSLGAVDYITKPFQLEEVEARVRLHLELARLRHEQARHVAQLEEAVALRTRELLKAKDRLAILDRAKSDFLSLISHELRTPLHGVLGVAEMLLAANTDPDGATYKEIYEQSRQRLMSLIDDALLLTQIGVGVAGDAHATSDLLAVLWEARHRAEAFAAGRRVKFAPVPTDLGTVQGKANFLVRAIESLLVTAAKFAQPGTAVRLAGSLEGNAARLVIEADGQNVPAALVPHFFDLLAISQPIAAGGDLGLGPALAERIVSLYGGTVSLENTSPAGIRLVVHLKAEPSQSGGA
jgi:two-component system sensor histidine kinase/response regulator